MLKCKVEAPPSISANPMAFAYDKLAADPMLAPFFQGSDINLLKWHQFNMMSIAFSFVPESFDVEELVLKKHARFFDVGLTCVHFDRVVRHFENTLHELGVADKIVQEAITILLPLREVFEKGVLEAEARRRAVLRNHILKTATVTAICGAGLTFLWMSRHHGRFTKHRS